MTNAFRRTASFHIESLSEGFIEALEGWAAWIADPQGHANDTKAGLCSKLLYYEGLNPRPARPITPTEAGGLRALLSMVERVRAMSAVERARRGMNDGYLRSFCSGPMTRPGWTYIRDALGIPDAAGNKIDILPITLQSLDTYRPAAWEMAPTAAAVMNTLRRAGYTRPGPPAPGYDSVADLIEPGTYDNVADYEAQMDALGVVQAASSTTGGQGNQGPPNTGGQGNPPPGGGPAGDPTGDPSTASTTDGRP